MPIHADLAGKLQAINHAEARVIASHLGLRNPTQLQLDNIVASGKQLASQLGPRGVEVARAAKAPLSELAHASSTFAPARQGSGWAGSRAIPKSLNKVLFGLPLLGTWLANSGIGQEATPETIGRDLRFADQNPSKVLPGAPAGTGELPPELQALANYYRLKAQ